MVYLQCNRVKRVANGDADEKSEARPQRLLLTGTPQTLLVGFEGERSNRTSSECTRKRVQARLVRVTTQYNDNYIF